MESTSTIISTSTSTTTSKPKFNPLIALLVGIFGSASWVVPNGIWVEQGVHTQTLPEGWALGSVLTIIFQIASIVPIIYVILDKYTNVKMNRPVLILISLIILAACVLPFGFYNQINVEILGKKRSIVVYFLSFFIGGVSILSDVLFIPYMKNLPEMYLQAYFVGMGSSALVPSVFSIIQGASSYDCVWVNTTDDSHLEPRFNRIRFSVPVFYIIILAWTVLGVISFFLIHWKRNFVNKLYFGKNYEESKKEEEEHVVNLVEPNVEKNSRNKDIILLVLIAIVFIQIGTLLPSIMSFVSLPFSPTAYFWCLTLGALFQPIGAFTTYLIKIKKLSTMIILCTIGMAATLFSVFLAFKSPNPIIEGPWGGVMVVTLTTFIFYLGCFCRSVLFEMYRDGGRNEVEQHRRLLNAGFFGQAGASAGTCVVFLTINVFEVFKSAPSC